VDRYFGLSKAFTALHSVDSCPRSELMQMADSHL
jgi:hypothetical protein